MKLLHVALVFALAASASTVFAARPGYTYAGVGYVKQDLDIDYAPDCTQDGLFLEGSLAFDGQLFGHLRHVDVTSDSGRCGSTSTSISAGFRNNYGNSSSVYAMASLVNRDYGPDSDAGLGISLGIRTMYQPDVELGFSVGYESIDDYSQLYIDGSARYMIVPQFGLSIDLGINEDGNTSMGVGGRYYF